MPTVPLDKSLLGDRKHGEPQTSALRAEWIGGNPSVVDNDFDVVSSSKAKIAKERLDWRILSDKIHRLSVICRFTTSL